MLKRGGILLLAVAGLLWGQTVLRAETASIEGRWLTMEGKSTIEIYRKGEELCGRIVALKEPLTPEGNPKNDRHNPDPEKRAQLLVGLDLVWGFKQTADNQWAHGRIYDPQSGKTYYCKLTLEGDTLVVRGSLDRWGLAGKTVEWTRQTHQDEDTQ